MKNKNLAGEYKMIGSVWVIESKDKGFDCRFQVDGIKRGDYTKTITPVFKGWREVASGYNYKKNVEVIIYAKTFASEREMLKWVKEKVTFHTTYTKCDQKCTTKTLIEEKSEVKDGATNNHRFIPS